jgi:hypothetical protein
VFVDDRFPSLELLMRRSKKGTPDHNMLRILYTLLLPAFTKSVLDFLFFACTQILKDLAPSGQPLQVLAGTAGSPRSPPPLPPSMDAPEASGSPMDAPEATMVVPGQG